MEKETLKIQFRCNSNVSLNGVATFASIPVAFIAVPVQIKLKLISEELLPFLTKGVGFSFEWDNTLFTGLVNDIVSENGLFLVCVIRSMAHNVSVNVTDELKEVSW